MNINKKIKQIALYRIINCITTDGTSPIVIKLIVSQILIFKSLQSLNTNGH